MNTKLLPASPAASRSGRPELSPTKRQARGWFDRQYRQRMLRTDLLTVIAWASVAASVALWLADGGAAATTTVAEAFTAAGIVTGLIGMDLVLLMLLLAARIPFVDRTIGHDRALEFHGKLGKPSLYLLLAHGVLLIIGYGLAEGLDPVSEAVNLWIQVPDMWLAFVSMALFIAVVVTSLVAVRRRFPYEFWYVVHLLTYAAVATSIPHQFSVGGLFAAGTWQRWYWLAIWTYTGTALVYFRILEPVLATARHQLTVARVEAVAPGVVNIVMRGRKLDELAGTGGRFFIWRFLAPGMWWHPHPFSLSAEPVFNGPAGEGTLRVTVRNLGNGSAQLLKLRKGTKVALEGPYGLLSTAARTKNKVVMIGAGIGITPLRALLETTPFAPGEATVLLRGHTDRELYLSREILDLCQARGVRLFHLTGRRSPTNSRSRSNSRSRTNSTWLPEDAVRNGYSLTSYVPDIADADVYVCGPAAWAENVIADAVQAGVREEQIHHERFDW